MPQDRSGDPWSGVTYNGFSGTGPAAPRAEARQFEPHEYERPPPPRRGVSKRMLAGGVAVAATLGLLFGVLAKPDFGDDGPVRKPMQPRTQVAATVPIEVAPVVAPPTPKTSGRLEVLPPDLASAAAAPVRAPPPPPRPASRPVEVAEAPPVVSASAREPEPRVAVARAEPAFNCRYARSRSERMVCSDDLLARLDRRLNRAFQRAVESGVPLRELRGEQDDWLAIREDAARFSPDAVESVYRQRIRELEEMAG